MFAYIKMNYGIITSKELDSRKLEDILGVLLAVLFLCILAGNQTAALPAVTDSFGVSESITEDSGILPEIGGIGLDKELQLLADNRLSEMIGLPEFPEIHAPYNPQADNTPVSAGGNLGNMLSEPKLPEIIAQEPSVPAPVTVPEESEPLPDEQPEVSDIPEVPSDDVKEEEQTFSCGGFLCNASGMIIGCQDVLVIDGVLCLPSSGECTGIAAGVLDSLGTEVYEVYIPANIVSIEEGAFDGLAELMFIQVHPGNPVYGSSEGYLYRK